MKEPLALTGVVYADQAKAKVLMEGDIVLQLEDTLHFKVVSVTDWHDIWLTQTISPGLTAADLPAIADRLAHLLETSTPAFRQAEWEPGLQQYALVSTDDVLRRLLNPPF